MNKTKSAAMVLATATAAQDTPFDTLYVVCNDCLGTPLHSLVEASAKLSQLKSEYPLLKFKLVIEVGGQCALT